MTAAAVVGSLGGVALATRVSPAALRKGLCLLHHRDDDVHGLEAGPLVPRARPRDDATFEVEHERGARDSAERNREHGVATNTATIAIGFAEVKRRIVALQQIARRFAK